LKHQNSDTRALSGNIDIGAYEYSSTLSINNLDFDNKISISPNPVYNVFVIKIENEILEKAIIYDGLGQQVKLVDSNEVNISKLKDGIYFLKITSKSGKIFTETIIKY